MSESSFDWFVQMAGGIVLGPMPREDLTELAASGGLMPSDLVRKGEEGEWRPASEVSGLLPELADDATTLGESPEDADFELQPGLQLIDEPPEIDFPSEPQSLPEPVNGSPSYEPQLPAHLDLVPESAPAEPPKPSPRRSKKPEVAHTSASTEPGFDPLSDLDAPADQDLPDEPSFDPSLLADVHQSPFPEEEEEDSSLHTMQSDQLPADEEVALQPLKGKKPAASRPSGRPARGQSQAFQTAKNAAGQVWSFLPRSLQRKAIFAVIGAVLFGILKLVAPSLLPSGEPYIYASLSSIHDEMLAFDSGDADPSGWTDFSQWAGEELELNRPWLEENAGPGNRGRSLLLYVTRDLQEMLKVPPGTERPHQQRVAGFIEQLDELYTSADD
jgi:hypothetical protein